MLRPCLVLLNAKNKTKQNWNYMFSNMLNDSTASDKQNKVIIVDRYELTWTHCTISLQFKLLVITALSGQIGWTEHLWTNPSNKQQEKKNAHSVVLDYIFKDMYMLSFGHKYPPTPN